MNDSAPKPGPHLHQPPTLAELSELHARHASRILLDPPNHVSAADIESAAETHAAVARACAHAALANRPHHPSPRVVKL